MKEYFFKYIIFFICIIFLICGEKKEKIKLNFSSSQSESIEESDESTNTIYTRLNISRKGKLVLGITNFKNNSGNKSLNWLAQGITNMLASGLSQARFLEIVSPDRLKDLMETVGTSQNFKINKYLVEKITEKEKIDVLINGEYDYSNNELLIKSEIYNTIQFQITHTDTVKGTTLENILGMVNNLSAKIREHLKIELDKDYVIAKTYTNNYEAFRNFSKGLEEEEKGLFEQAIESYINAIKLDPTFAKAYFKVVTNILRNLNIENLERCQPFIKAALKYRDKLEEKEIFVLNGYNKLLLNKIKEAKSDFKEFTNKYPGEKEGYHNLAKVLVMNEEYQNAVEQLNIALQLDPKHFECLRLKSQILMRLGDYKNALKISTNIVDLFPNRVQSFMNLGYTYIRMGNLEKSIEQFKKAMKLEPDYFWPYIFLGRLLSENNKFKESLDYFEKAYQRIPRYSENILYEVVKYILDNHFSIGNFSKALNLLEDIEEEEIFAEAKEYLPALSLLKSEILIEFERYNEATNIVLENKDKTIYPDNAYTILGEIYLKSNNTDIIEQIDKIIENGNENIKNQILNSFKYLKENSWAEAISSLNQLTTRTGELKLKYYLGIAYYNNNEFEKASRIFNEIMNNKEISNPRQSLLKPALEYNYALNLTKMKNSTRSKKIAENIVNKYYNKDKVNIKSVKLAKELLDELKKVSL